MTDETEQIRAKAEELTDALMSDIMPWPRLRELLAVQTVDASSAALLALGGHQPEWLLLTRDGRTAVFQWDPPGGLGRWEVFSTTDLSAYGVEIGVLGDVLRSRS
ncbi:MAG: hypothetical protein QOE83_1990 [Actinomycetota bacterium]|jgi:hypothetical protein|nr:hypothetical protein [Actinomycetota bacterium]